MPTPDFFGISDRVKRLTAPAGYEDVHQDGYSWARAGTTYEDTTRIGPDDWNQIIANLRALLTTPGVVLDDTDPRTPFLLRDVITGFIGIKAAALLPAGVLAAIPDLAANEAFMNALAAAFPEGEQVGVLAAALWSTSGAVRGLSALTGDFDGQFAQVTGPDSGSHVDPITGATVPNEGLYSWVESSSVWTRLSGSIVAAFVDRAHGALVHRWGQAQVGKANHEDDFLRPSPYIDPFLLEGSANAVLTTTADAGGNKVNADGTLTIGAGSYHEWPSTFKDTAYDPDGYYTIYVVPVDPARAADISVTWRQNDAATASVENTVDRSQYGIVKVTFRNRNTTGGLAFNAIFPRINNGGATGLEYYRPSLSRVDNANIPYDMLRWFKSEPPSYQPEIRSYEFWRDPAFFQLNTDQWLRDTTIAVDSVAGSDAAAGTRYAPKQTLAAIGAAGSLASGAVVALRRGSTWREQLAAYYGSTAWDAAFVADDRGAKGNMPVISSWLSIADGAITDNGDGTFSFTFTPRASTQPVLNATYNNGYHRILVRERNVALDAAGLPIAAGTVLRWTANTTDLNAGDGRSYATYNSGTGQWTVTFKPRAGVTPLDGSNTYEVTAQAACITQASGSTNEKNASFIGIHFDGAADGYGMIASGTGSLVDFCVLTGGDTHHAVMASMIARRSLIASVGDVTDSIAVSFSAGDNMQDTVTLYDRCFIFAAGGPYAHNSVGETKLAEALITEGSYIPGRRHPLYNGLVASLGTAGQTRNVIRRRNYGRSLLQDADLFGTTFSPNVVSEENFVDGVARLQATRGGSRNNIFIMTNYGDRTAGAPANRGALGVYASPDGVFENNLVVITHEGGQFVPSSVSNYLADYSGTVIQSPILGNGIAPTAQSVVRRNIFVIYMPYAAAQGQGTVLFSGLQTAFGNVDLNENIYVIVNPGSSLSIAGPTQTLAAPPTYFPPAAIGGTADAMTLTSGQSLGANPDTITFTKSASANTGAATVAIDGMSAVAIKSSAGAALTAGQLAASTRYTARLVSGEYWLCTFQTHLDGIGSFRPKTGYEADGKFIDARGHPLGINSVFRDFANRDLRWAWTDVADQIIRFNTERIRNGLLPCGPSWTVNRNVEQLSADQVYRMISRRSPLLTS